MVLASSLPAPYLLMLGVLLRRATGIPQAWAIAASAVFCLLYIGARGFPLGRTDEGAAVRADVRRVPAAPPDRGL
jgi:hypothetical protein